MHIGSCLFRLVKYEVEDDLNVVVNCQCQKCRSAHGAEFAPIAMLLADKLRMLKGEELLSRYEVVNVAAFRCFALNAARVYLIILRASFLLVS